MRKTLLLLFVLLGMNLFAQNPNDAIAVFSGGGGTMRMMEIKAKPEKTKGSIYYNKLWRTGNIYLFSGEEIKNYPLKYDLKSLRYEINVDNSIKIISIGAIKKVEWFIPETGGKEIFVNTSSYDDIDGYGMIKVLTEGKITLLKKTELKLIEGNYNTALNVGNRASKYVKNEKYFALFNDEVKKVITRKRRVLRLFGDKYDDVKKWAKEQGLSYNKDRDLSKIFNYYNSI